MDGPAAISLRMPDAEGMTAEPTLSIVMPAHDTEAYVGAALDSVFAQSYMATDVTVVDDGSTDGTQAVLDGYGDRVTVLEQATAGSAAARNLAATRAAGEYLVLLDSDDVLLPWALEEIAAAIVRHGRPALLMSSWFKFENEGDLPRLRSPVRSTAWPDLLRSLEGRRQITMASVVRSDVYQRIGGFSVGSPSSEDIDLWLRLGTEPGFVYLDGGPLYGYRQRPGSMTRSAARLERGIKKLVSNELRGVYPGGSERAPERRTLLTRNVVWGVRRCWELGDRWAGLRLLTVSLPLFRDRAAWSELGRLGPWAIGRARRGVRGAARRALRP